MPTITVSELTTRIKNLFDSDRSYRNLTVIGEVIGMTDQREKSGHLYFSLKDSKARISCAMFKYARDSARERGLQFELKNGDKIEATGNVSVYPPNGNYQLIVTKITAEGTGELAAQFFALKEKLQKEGLFDPKYKKPVPKYIHRLGVVTSDTGDAVKDIIKNAKERNPYVQIILYPSLVQGNDAPAKLIRGLQELDKDKYHLDAIIIGRGGGTGGALEDLRAFNDENLARAIFRCKTPVISGIGHEQDITIADFVVDQRESTPTGAGIRGGFDYSAFENTLKAYREALYMPVLNLINRYRQSLSAYKTELQYRGPESLVNQMHQQLDGYIDKLLAQMKNALLLAGNQLAPCKQALSVQMERTCQLSVKQKDLMRNELILEMNRRLIQEKSRLRIYCERLNGLSPLKRIQDGYGYLAKEDGKRIFSVDDVELNKTIHIYLSDGRIDARTENIVRDIFKTEGTKNG